MALSEHSEIGTSSPCSGRARRTVGQLYEGVEGKRGKNGLKVGSTGDTTYGRPVATATIDGKDIGEPLIRQGRAIREPKCLARYLSGCVVTRRRKRRLGRRGAGPSSSSSTHRASFGTAAGFSVSIALHPNVALARTRLR